MKSTESVKELLTHPFTVFGAVFTTASAVVPQLQPVLDLLLSQSGSLFTVTAVGASTLAPEIPWLPQGTLQAAAVVTGGLYVTHHGLKFVSAARSRFGGDD